MAAKRRTPAARRVPAGPRGPRGPRGPAGPSVNIPQPLNVTVTQATPAAAAPAPPAAAPAQNRRFWRYLGYGLGLAAVGGILYFGYHSLFGKKPNPYDKDLVLMELTDRAKYALRTFDFKGSDIGLITGYGCETKEKDDKIEVDCDKTFKIILEGQDDKAKYVTLSGAWKLLNDRDVQGGRQALLEIEKPYVSKVRGTGWPVRTSELNGEKVWLVEPSYISWIANDLHPVDTSGRPYKRHETLRNGSNPPVYVPRTSRE